MILVDPSPKCREDTRGGEGGRGTATIIAVGEGWGRILTSTLASYCPSLGWDAKVAVCDAIVDGLVVLLGGGAKEEEDEEKRKTKFSSFQEAAEAVEARREEEVDNDDNAC
jgi:hypothetical protein